MASGDDDSENAFGLGSPLVNGVPLVYRLEKTLGIKLLNVETGLLPPR